MKQDGSFEFVNFGKVDPDVTSISERNSFERLPDFLCGVPVRCRVEHLHEENTKGLPRLKITYTTFHDGKRYGATITYFSKNPKRIYPLLNVLGIKEFTNEAQVRHKHLAVIFEKKGDWHNATAYLPKDKGEEGDFSPPVTGTTSYDVPPPGKDDVPF